MSSLSVSATSALRTAAIGLTCCLTVVMSACGSGKATSTQTPTAHPSTATRGFGLSPAPSVMALVPASVRSKAVLKNAIYNDGAPQQFVKNGELVGVQPDLAEAVSEVMGIKFQIIPVGSFDSIIPGLQGGRYDIAFADFGITAAREKVVDFVEEFTLGTSFGTKKSGGKSITSAEQLCGLKIGTLAGSYFIDQVKALSAKCASSGKPKIGLLTYPTQADAVLAVSNGRTDAFAISTDQVAYAAAQPGASLQAQPFVYQPIPQGIGVPKGSPLAKPIQAAIREIIADGTYAKILQKWGIGNAAITADQVSINPTVS